MTVMIELVRAHPGELTLVAIGPLTNVALAMLLAEDFAGRLRSLVIMGGVFTEVTGHAEMPGEFNVWSDPAAARVVLQSGVVTTWVGLDVTRRVRLDRAAAGHMAADEHPFTSYAGQYSVAWIDHLARTEGAETDSCALHDPLAVAAVSRPDLLTFADARLDVQLDGVARGVMVADWVRAPSHHDQDLGRARPGRPTPGWLSPWTRTASGGTSPTRYAAYEARMTRKVKAAGGRPVRLGILGTGDRGMAYGRESVRSGEAVITALAEPREGRRLLAAAEFGVAADRAVADWRELAARPDLDVDAVVVSTPDRQHTEPALAFLARGLPLLLEKPMAPTPEEARSIADAAEEASVMVCVAHVLRYSAYTEAVKAVLDSGALGDVVSVEHLEPVGWWHHAHSFVRGNWRREDESNPMLMAKCCHDVDWLSYIVDRPARRVSSFGSLTHFTAANKPAGAAARCLDCAVERQCPYSARRIYLERVPDHSARIWPLSILAERVDEEAITAALRDGPYGRCVYDCDNDVVDHQVVNIEYEGGVTASLTMTAFTPMTFRKTRIFGTHGMLEGDGYSLSIFDFLTGDTTATQVIDPADAEAGEGHLGADAALTRSFLAAVRDQGSESHPHLAAGESAHATRSSGRPSGPGDWARWRG